jgi:hypothetical protein
VRARLLGLKLLRLEADVVLVPATTLVPDSTVRMPPGTEPAATRTSRQGIDPGTAPACLWHARRLLAESEDVLDGVRLDSPLPPRR